MEYETWEAYRELDRMPDPSRNPSESAHRRIEELEAAIRKHRREAEVVAGNPPLYEDHDLELWAVVN